MTFTVEMVTESLKYDFNVSFPQSLHCTFISQSKNNCKNSPALLHPKMNF